MQERSTAAVRTPWDASWHLRAELARILDLLARCLAAQRERGRTPAGDAVGGMVIESGETEGLIAEIALDLSDAHDEDAADPQPARLRDEIAGRAISGAAAGADLPLLHAQRAFELAHVEYDALLLALAVEVDARFGRIVAYLNDHVGRTRPTLALALAVAAAEDSSERQSPVELDARPIIRDGLLELDGDGPLPSLTFRLPHGLAARLSGLSSDIDLARVKVDAPDGSLLDRLVLDEPLGQQLTAWSDGIRAGQRPLPLVAAGRPGSGRRTAVAAALFRAGRSAVQVDLDAEHAVDRLRVARREARWHRAALLARLPAALPSSWDWPATWQALAIDGPVALIVTPERAAEAAAHAPVEPAIIRFEESGVTSRARMWSMLVPPNTGIKDSEVAELAARFPFGPGRIARAVRRATADLALRPAGNRRLDLPSLIDAARAVDSTTLGPLAQKLPLPYERADLVVPAQVGAELDLALAWVRYRHRVLHEWGFVRRVTMGHGLTALFSGPSGTGKTMAAQVLARELGLDIYRIDLSQIMSKYIGDTEKNLAQVFGARVGVLFFDEAEVLLGRRHETKEARDRYANVEIAYLLQRMEEYDGVTVLATNRAQDIDDAFVRRLHVVVDFPMPSEAERLRIWEGMLPSGAARAGDLDLAALAREFEISGGQIKNAALAGAYLAAAANDAIGNTHLRRAARRELVKSGKIADV
jgi:hypothetical protein